MLSSRPENRLMAVGAIHRLATLDNSNMRTGMENFTEKGSCKLMNLHWTAAQWPVRHSTFWCATKTVPTPTTCLRSVFNGWLRKLLPLKWPNGNCTGIRCFTSCRGTETRLLTIQSWRRRLTLVRGGKRSDGEGRKMRREEGHEGCCCDNFPLFC